MITVSHVRQCPICDKPIVGFHIIRAEQLKAAWDVKLQSGRYRCIVDTNGEHRALYVRDEE